MGPTYVCVCVCACSGCVWCVCGVCVGVVCVCVGVVGGGRSYKQARALESEMH